MERIKYSTNNIHTIPAIIDKFSLDESETNNLHNYVIHHDNSHIIAFEWAVVNKKLEIVKFVIKKYFGSYGSINFVKNLINFSSRTGHIEIVNYLIEYYSESSYYNCIYLTEALYAATVNSHYNLVKFLVEKGARISDDDCNRSAIISSLSHDNIKITKYLIKKNSKINNSYILNSHYVVGKCDVMKLLIENSDGNYDINDLLQRNFGCLDVIKYLISNGADFKYENHRILRQSISWCCIETLEYLLELYSENNLPIPDNLITSKINDTNRILIQYAKEDQYKLFNPDIVRHLTNCKSARKT